MTIATGVCILGLVPALAAQHLVEDDAERPDVGALVDRPAFRLLRRHVGHIQNSKAQLEHLARRRAEIEGLLEQGRRMTRHVEDLVEDWLDELERAPPQRPGP